MQSQRQSPTVSPEWFRFTRDSRLLKHSSFEAVYKNGRRHFSASMTFFYVLRVAGAEESKIVSSQAQVGFTVGRVLGGSVDRNRMKRRVRDVVRLGLPSLKRALGERSLAVEIVINPKKSALKADHKMLQSEVDRAFEVIAAAKPGAISGRAAKQVIGSSKVSN